MTHTQSGTALGEVLNAFGERIDYTLHQPGGGNKGLIVIFVHGVTGTKDKPLLEICCKTLADEGIASVRFSAAGSGDSGGSFEDTGPLKSSSDLLSVVQAAKAKGYDRVAVVGHSQGGTAAMQSALEPDNGIDFGISIAGVVDTGFFFRNQLDPLKDGDLIFDVEEKPMNPKFRQAWSQLEPPLPRLHEIKIPWLLLHSRADEMVHFSDSTKAAEAMQGQAVLWPVDDGSDHSFTGTESLPAKIILGWLRTQLSLIP